MLSVKSEGSLLCEVPSFKLKNCADIIAPILSDLINEAVKLVVHPDLLKIARVTAIHKSGSTFDMKNYRHISVLPFMNKVFDRALHTRLITFFHKFRIIYEDQYGFLKNESTTDAILKFTQECYSALNGRLHLISVFLDFSKAFDTICHDILLKKLEKMVYERLILTSSDRIFLTGLSLFKCMVRIMSKLHLLVVFLEAQLSEHSSF